MIAGNSSYLKRRWNDFESFVEGVLYDRDLSISARLFGLFLNPFSYLFSLIVWIRSFLYESNIFLKRERLNASAICVSRGRSNKQRERDRERKKTFPERDKDILFRVDVALPSILLPCCYSYSSSNDDTRGTPRATTRRSASLPFRASSSRCSQMCSRLRVRVRARLLLLLLLRVLCAWRSQCDAFATSTHQ